jgi:hypothetical protein
MTSYKPVNDKPERPPIARIAIIDLDRGTVLYAQYNPKEIQVDKSADWSETPNGKGDGPELTYAATKARSIALELMFDTLEAGTDVHGEYVQHLILLLDVIKATGTEDQKRPPRIQIDWGGKMPKFIGVVASVSTKYTMFLPDGTPVRALCSCKFTEASRFSFKKPKG